MDRSDLEPLVKAGARLLDKRSPEWFTLFTDEVWSFFNPFDEYHDILGTVYGSFQEGLHEIGLWESEDPWLEAQQYGFDMDYLAISHYDPESDARTDLSSLWYEEIIDRQENGIPDE